MSRTPHKAPSILSRNGARAFGFVLIALTLASIVVAGTVAAQPGPDRAGHGGPHFTEAPGHGEGDAGAHIAQTLLLRRADADHDGAVTAAEWAELVATLDGQFATLDDDADGSVDVPARIRHRRFERGRHPRMRRGHRDGAKPAGLRPHMRWRTGAGMIRAADRAGDDDGTLTREEWQRFVTEADTDGDGGLDTGEIFEALRASHPEITEHPRPEPPTIDEMLEQFDAFDENGNGQLDEDEGPAHRRRFQRRGHGG